MTLSSCVPCCFTISSWSSLYSLLDGGREREHYNPDLSPISKSYLNLRKIRIIEFFVIMLPKKIFLVQWLSLFHNEPFFVFMYTIFSLTCDTVHLFKAFICSLHFISFELLWAWQADLVLSFLSEAFLNETTCSSVVKGKFSRRSQSSVWDQEGLGHLLGGL